MYVEVVKKILCTMCRIYFFEGNTPQIIACKDNEFLPENIALGYKLYISLRRLFLRNLSFFFSKYIQLLIKHKKLHCHTRVLYSRRVIKKKFRFVHRCYYISMSMLYILLQSRFAIMRLESD